jgi:hypothetical protein
MSEWHIAGIELPGGETASGGRTAASLRRRRLMTRRSARL